MSGKCKVCGEETNGRLMCKECEMKVSIEAYIYEYNLYVKERKAG